MKLLKQSILFLCTAMSGWAIEPAASTFTSAENNLHPYLSLGTSSIAQMPYAINTAIGVRFAKNDSLVGFDGSFNYTTNVIFNGIDIKGLIPIYFSPHQIHRSFYFGPYATVSKDFKKWVDIFGVDLERVIHKSPYCEMGLTFGKNMGDQKIHSFWQLSMKGLVIERRLQLDPVDWKLKETQYGTKLFLPGFLRFDWGFVY